MSEETKRKLDFCPVCKTHLSIMRADKDSIERRCPTCKVIVTDQIKEKDYDVK